MRKYVRALIEPESVKTVALALGVSQGHLNDQLGGKKNISFDTVDLVARHRGKTGTQVLSGLASAASDLDRESPGWDAYVTPAPSAPQVPVRKPKLVERGQSQKAKPRKAAESA